MRKSDHETHLPAQQTPQKARTRLYEKNEHTPRQKNLKPSPQNGPPPAHTRLTFTKKARLLKASEFEPLSRGKTVAGAYILVTSSTHTTGPKLGIAVSKRFGKAHERNRFKRLAREAFRHLQKKLESTAILIRPLPKAKEASCALIQEELFSLLARKKETL